MSLRLVQGFYVIECRRGKMGLGNYTLTPKYRRIKTDADNFEPRTLVCHPKDIVNAIRKTLYHFRQNVGTSQLWIQTKSMLSNCDRMENTKSLWLGIQWFATRRRDDCGKSSIHKRRQPTSPISKCITNNCGLYAIANATALTYGIDPCTQVNIPRMMREHLFKCLEQKHLEPFPITNNSKRKRKTMRNTIDVPMYCVTCLIQGQCIYTAMYVLVNTIFSVLTLTHLLQTLPSIRAQSADNNRC